jgi:hypothetical protein
MSNKMASSLHTLPVELVYRIFDQLDELTIFWSCTNVCTRLDAIIDTYHPYQVIFSFLIIKSLAGVPGIAREILSFMHGKSTNFSLMVFYNLSIMGIAKCPRTTFPFLTFLFLKFLSF